MGRSKKAVDGTKFESFLAKLSGLRAQSFPTQRPRLGPTRLCSPTKAHVLTMARRPRPDRFGRDGTAAYSGRADEPGASTLEHAEFEDLIKSLDALK